MRRFPERARFGRFCLLWGLLASLELAAGSFAQELLISEFLASNDLGLKDRDGDASDWIEVWNAGGSSVDLGGWHLTDDANDLTKWTFPSLQLAPGQFVVVFASGKDGAVEGPELHTNFNLAADGEYLAVVKSDGSTVVHEYAPAYPQQHQDVSYGVSDGGGATQLIALGAAARFRVPSGEAGGLDWTLPAYDDGAWGAASIGVGYESDAGGPPPPDATNLALNAAASQSSEYGGFPAGLGVDGNPGNFTATAADDPSPWWEVDLGRVYPLARIVVHNRGDGCCQSRLRDITVSVVDADGETSFESSLLNGENVLGGGGTGGPSELALDLRALTGDAVPGRYLRVTRTPDPDNSGTGGIGGPDEASVLSLGEVEVFGAQSAHSDWIRTDVGALLRGVNASAYLRAAFDVSSPGAFERLTLRVRYDDGFVAYLNGVDVARRNAPGAPGQAPAWNAAATVEHPDAAGAAAEQIEITPQAGALVAGKNVLAVHGLNVSAGDADFLLAPELEGRTASAQDARYFQQPTPGAPNDPNGVIDFVADTKFSVGRGFFDAPFDVEITTATAGAKIRYTLDRSAPTATTGLAYGGAIHVSASTVIRAAAFKPGYAPTNVDTNTYLFLDDVLKQTVMLKDIVTSPIYGPELKPSLLAVSTVSLVTSATINGTNEVPVSVELLNPDGTKDFQIDAGVKKVGGHSLGSYPKNNMRLYFRKKYGEAKLKYPLYKGLPYGDRAVEAFDRLNLRSGSHDSVFYLGDSQQAPANAQYIRNRWINDLQFQMGQPSINGRFVHVYINGTYWGFYDLMEWASQEYFSSYFGGEDADYVSTNSGRPLGDSNISVWNRIVSLAGRYSEFQRYVDVTNFADYLVLNFYGGNAWDWNPNQNWMAGGPIAPDQGGFKFICWDSDIILRWTNDFNLDRAGPSNLFNALKANVEFKTLLGDRAHRHLFNGGALTPKKVEESYSRRAEEIRSSLVAETARWRWNSRVWTRDNQWQKELNRLLTDFIPRRTGILLNQLRQAGLYPRLEAPTFNRNGGRVPKGFAATVDAPAGTVFFTTDGSDPRLAGGGVGPTAQEVGAASEEKLISSGAPVRALVPADGSLGLDWVAIDYDDSTWKAGTTGVGFERATGFEGVIATDVGSEAFERNASVYLRVPFEVEDPSALKSLTLRMKYDDGFVAYLNGERAASANAPDAPAWNANATASHADNLALVFQDFDVSGALDRLRKGRNVLAIHGLNLTPSSNDFLILPELAGSIGESGSIAIDEPMTIKARSKDGPQWSALSEAFFWFDIPLRVTEVMYHPRPASPALIDAEEFEFIELQNMGVSTLDLSGILISGGVAFDFSRGFVRSLRPNAVALVVENAVAFRERYGVAGLNVAGEYSGKLGNGCDILSLQGPRGETILEFSYSDAWHPRTDGEGRSLVLAKAAAAPEEWGDAATWAESPAVDGSPGFVEARPGAAGLQLPSDVTQDAILDLSDVVSLLGHLFLGHPSALPCGDGTLLDDGNRRLLDSTGDGKVDLTDAIRVLHYLFLSAPPPVLGTSCISIDGCPSVCAR